MIHKFEIPMAIVVGLALASGMAPTVVQGEEIAPSVGVPPQMQSEGETAAKPTCCGKTENDNHQKHEGGNGEIDRLMVRINSTIGDTQQAAMAELLNKLVEQRQQMHGKAVDHGSGCPTMNKTDMDRNQPEDDSANHEMHQ